MLGSTLTKYLTPYVSEVVEMNRSGVPVLAGNRALTYDAVLGNPIREYLEKEQFDYVINAIGLIKQLIDETDKKVLKNAYLVNSNLPRDLSAYAKDTSTAVIQIGTDCVYSGQVGNYSEHSKFDCVDLYGLSKVSGEEESKSLMTIRCSIIGHEIKSPVSLMDWFLSQPKSATVRGYTNHYWNGVTTLAFARVIRGIIDHKMFSPEILHLVPKDQITKFELLQNLAKEFQRTDIHIRAFPTESGVNRTLITLFPDKNEQLWLSAGYTQIPSIAELIKEYAEWSS
jgi:dTDP-4-dehydrorhamnose reductase